MPDKANELTFQNDMIDQLGREGLAARHARGLQPRVGSV